MSVGYISDEQERKCPRCKYNAVCIVDAERGRYTFDFSAWTKLVMQEAIRRKSSKEISHCSWLMQIYIRRQEDIHAEREREKRAAEVYRKHLHTKGPRR